MLAGAGISVSKGWSWTSGTPRPASGGGCRRWWAGGGREGGFQERRPGQAPRLHRPAPGGHVAGSVSHPFIG